MIPMRDGVKLFTVIFTPDNQTDPLPILMRRTPMRRDNPYSPSHRVGHVGHGAR
ncbi:MAG: hypothetical protein ABR535_10110 [Pyrinomonadaceae bacterium]